MVHQKRIRVQPSKNESLYVCYGFTTLVGVQPEMDDILILVLEHVVHF